MEPALFIACVAAGMAGVALVFAFFCAVRLNRVEWELENLKQEVVHGVSPFPIPPEASPSPFPVPTEGDRPAFLRRQAE